jgi:transmembrane sensor
LSVAPGINEIDSAAADWLARVDRGLSAEEGELFAAWLKADPRHMGAYARLDAVFVHFERAKALGPDFDFRTGGAHELALAPKPAKVARRRWMGGAAAAAVIATIAPLSYKYLVPTRYSSALGEVRIEPMPDGSTVTLNTQSAISVRYTPLRREVRLLAGEALFDVAKDSGRPFIVLTGKTSVRAVGTSFSVRSLKGKPTEVLVREGIVDIGPENGVRAPLRVPANSRAIIPDVANPSAETVQVGMDRSVIARELSWREGMIAFEGVTLQQAVEEFQRYSSTRIIINDPEIAALPITGLFSAQNPSGFAHAVATSFGLKVGLTTNGMLMLWK